MSVVVSNPIPMEYQVKLELIFSFKKSLSKEAKKLKSTETEHPLTFSGQKSVMSYVPWKNSTVRDNNSDNAYICESQGFIRVIYFIR